MYETQTHPQSILFGALARIDILSAPTDVMLTLFASSKLTTHATATPKADTVYATHAATPLLEPPTGGPERMKVGLLRLLTLAPVPTCSHAHTLSPCTKLSPFSPPSRPRLTQTFPPLQPTNVSVEPVQARRSEWDVVLGQLGWVAVTASGPVQLRVFTPLV
jgi:hypothetical protein